MPGSDRPVDCCRSFALAASLALGALFAGCAEVAECTPSDPSFDIELTRELVASRTGGALVIEACVGNECSSASPAPSGELSFDSRYKRDAPIGGSVASGSEPAKTRITVTYSISEGSKKLVRLLVKQGDATLLDETATVRWSSSGDPCHSKPDSTTL